ncbi:MAG TPA: hypothetical protein VN577_09935 [Terriglobales bacterium]|nr:hypothetical protein [Terriglobales bacterium]
MAQDINLNGWVKVRRGLLTHYQTGLMTTTEFVVFHILLALADKATGSGKINARAICFWSDSQISEDMAGRALRGLEEKNYIVREIVPGRRSLYIFHVQKYLATAGADDGKVLTFTKNAKIVEKFADICEGFDVEPADEESAVGSPEESPEESAVGSDYTRREKRDGKRKTGETKNQKEGKKEGRKEDAQASPSLMSSINPAMTLEQSYEAFKHERRDDPLGYRAWIMSLHDQWNTRTGLSFDDDMDEARAADLFLHKGYDVVYQGIELIFACPKTAGVVWKDFRYFYENFDRTLRNAQAWQRKAHTAYLTKMGHVPDPVTVPEPEIAPPHNEMADECPGCHYQKYDCECGNG